MQVRIRLMGVLRSKLPPGSQGGMARLELETAATIAALLNQLGISAGHVHLIQVNGVPETDRERRLSEGDELVIFPPVAGG